MSLYMFRALSAHLQEDKLYTCSMWYCYSVNSSWWPVVESDTNICCIYTVYPPEDEHLRLETCRGT